MDKPLVSVICLCYNHERFVREAIASVVNQTYTPVQVIIADDASLDDSQRIILELKERYPFLELLLSRHNVGNCKAFNNAYALARGKYAIDFSTDDVMLPDRIEKQVAYMENAGDRTGLVFTDASYIAEDGKFIRNHFEHLFKKGLIKKIPQGNIYREVLATYFVPTPSLMIRRTVLDVLGGYDEQLAYEDFDLLVRSSRMSEYGFIDERLTRIRKVATSLSSRQYTHQDTQLHSTYLVCRKAQQLNKDELDHQALVKRVRFEFRQGVLSGKFEEAKLFYQFLRELKSVSLADVVLWMFNRPGISLSPLLKWYHRLRYD
jgi:glycosyltransferase involved in cell wall biosynthesis